MNADRLEQIAAVYAEARERAPATRGAFLDAACRDDADLRREVESLLAIDTDAYPFLTGTAVDRVIDVAASASAPTLQREPFCLAVGTRVGRYEVVAPAGAGGMGEVYRARDVDLGRDVALKVLPGMFASDARRLARFEREARILAALNHPHVAQIYGIERANGVSALVMEFVDGRTLAELIARAPLPLDEVRLLARQIAEALASAHEQGIIHRDLKPANIMIGRDFSVKVLDFGVASLPDPRADDLSVPESSPAETSSTEPRDFLFGTPAYISPEQVKGEPADRRSDVWAFGCVLYEMLTGRRAFSGNSVADTLAAVSRAEIDWAALPPDLPPALVATLKRCLDKDRRRRISDVAAALAVVDDVLSVQQPAATGRLHPLGTATAKALIALLIAAIGLAAIAWNTSRNPTSPDDRYAITPPAEQAIIAEGNTRNIAISTDGAHTAWVGPTSSLVVRSRNELQPRTLIRDVVASPFFSSDGQWIGYFFGNGPIKKISVRGGPATVLVKEGDNGLARGATWAADGTIVFATNNRATGLQLVSPGSAEPRVVTVPDRAAGESDHVWPEFLPDGRVLFTITGTVDNAQSTRIAVLDLDTRKYSVVIEGGSQAKYVASGHLVYVSAGRLTAIPFDLRRLRPTGAARAVVDSLLTTRGGAADFDVAADEGTLVYAAGATPFGGQRALSWVRRADAAVEMLDMPPRSYLYPRLSPDETQILLDVRDQDSDIWLWDRRRRVLANLTGHPALDRFPLWMPNGKHFVFASSRDDGRSAIYLQPIDNSRPPERLTTPSTEQQTPNAVTRDGRRLIFDWKGDLWVLDLVSRQVSPLVATPAIEQRSVLSPDERWLAYQIGDSPESDVFVRPWPDVETRVTQVSSGGGAQAWWSRNGELFFITPHADIMSVRAGRAPAWTGGRPELAVAKKVINVNPGAASTFDVSADGKRMLLVRFTEAEDEQRLPNLIVARNWVEELKRLVPTQ